MHRNDTSESQAQAILWKKLTAFGKIKSENVRKIREVDFLLKFFFVLKFFFQSFVVNSSQMMENSSFNLRTKKLYFLLSKLLSLFSSFNLLSIWEARNFIFFFQSSFNLRSWNLYFLLLIFFQFEKPVSTLNHKSF